MRHGLAGAISRPAEAQRATPQRQSGGEDGAADHGLPRATIHITIANATNPHSKTCEPVNAPKNSAIASTAISEPP